MCDFFIAQTSNQALSNSLSLTCCSCIFQVGQTAKVMLPTLKLSEMNENLTCPLCKGYLIDACTIVECLHSCE